MIPNIIHFIWFTGPKSREFSFVNYLAVRSAADLHPTVWVHVNEEPQGNRHWEAIRPYVTMVPTEPPADFGGVPLDCPQYQSDVTRLRILLAHGGVYLDTDTILLRSLAPFFNVPCVMAADRTDEADAMNAGIILAEPESPFIRLWLDNLVIGDTWAAHMTALPWRLARENPALVHLRPAPEFNPVAYGEDYIEDGDMAALDGAYAVHLWESYWNGHRRPIDAEYFASHDNAFTRRLSKFVQRRPKICVYSIAKNEAGFVERFCASATNADLILIADTGSTDDTVQLARSAGAVVHSIFISPWRFDTARNVALALVPADVDICVSLDLDEELQPGWREEIERVWEVGKTTRLSYGFDWGHGIVFQYEKIHSRIGYSWKHPCHEYPVPDGRCPETYAVTNQLLVVHKPDPTKSRGQYMDLLQLSVQEDPADPRNAFYYARELSFNGRWQEAIEAGKRYLALPGANWDGERCYACRVISRCYAEMGNYDGALKWARWATIEAPHTREPWVELAVVSYRTSRWAECYGAAMSALEVKDRLKTYTCDPKVWGAQPHDLASIAAWHLGFPKIAKEQAALAVELDPTDDRLAANLKFYEEVLNG